MATDSSHPENCSRPKELPTARPGTCTIQTERIRAAAVHERAIAAESGPAEQDGSDVPAATGPTIRNRSVSWKTERKESDV